MSSEALDLLKNLPEQSQEVQTFVERIFRFMKRAKFRAEDFSLFFAWGVGFLPSRILPGAWGGLIPPITIEGRHAKIDEYLSQNPWHPLEQESTLLDLGCGFPPRTSMDTANRFPDWQIIAADPSFGRYIIYNEYADYACFWDDGTIRYFQPSGLDLQRWDALYKNPTKTRERFGTLFNTLRSLQPETGPDELSIVEEGAVKLIKNPLRLFEKSNLSFREAGIGAIDVQNLDAVRCMNVLMYFDRRYREKTIHWVTEILKPGGLFICGVNWARSTFARYTVYQKESNRLVAREFAFSVDNIRAMQIASWFALHDDDYETCMLADTLAVLRSDVVFCHEFDEKMDQLLAEYEICPRGPDGYLGSVPIGIGPKN
jgi:SAM-dependent methyltransferase